MLLQRNVIYNFNISNKTFCWSLQTERQDIYPMAQRITLSIAFHTNLHWLFLIYYQLIRCGTHACRLWPACFRSALPLTTSPFLPFPRRKASEAQRQGQRPRERAQEASVGGGQGATGLGAAETPGASEGSLAPREVSMRPAPSLNPFHACNCNCDSFDEPTWAIKC